MPDYIPFPTPVPGNDGDREQIPAGEGNGFYDGQEIYVRVTATNADATNTPLVKTSPTANLPLGQVPDLSHGHESGRSQTRVSRSPGGVAKCILVLPCPGSCEADRVGIRARQ